MGNIGETLWNLLQQSGFFTLGWKNYVMIGFACLFLFLAIKKDIRL